MKFGDRVRVKSGMYKGRTGVVACADDQGPYGTCAVEVDPNAVEYRLYISDLELFDNSPLGGSGSGSIQREDDLIMAQAFESLKAQEPTREIYTDYRPAGGLKYDQDKPRTDLLDAYALEETAKVLAFGAKKYAAHNWRKGIAYSRLVGAILRHAFAILRGEWLDPETGLPHAAHIQCTSMFLTWMGKHRKDRDDLWRPAVNEPSSKEKTND